jgi:hypothetical protein
MEGARKYTSTHSETLLTEFCLSLRSCGGCGTVNLSSLELTGGRLLGYPQKLSHLLQHSIYEDIEPFLLISVYSFCYTAHCTQNCNVHSAHGCKRIRQYSRSTDENFRNLLELSPSSYVYLPQQIFTTNLKLLITIYTDSKL